VEQLCKLNSAFRGELLGFVILNEVKNQLDNHSLQVWSRTSLSTQQARPTHALR